MLMPKYQKLIEKIQIWQKDPRYSTFITSAEIALIQEALETIQFLEIFFKERRIAENEKPSML